jgi:hypothetical protein
MHDGRMQSKKEGMLTASPIDPVADAEHPSSEYQYNHVSSFR